MERFYGGAITSEEKKAWAAHAQKEGFENLWNWIKWIVRKHIKEI